MSRLWKLRLQTLCITGKLESFWLVSDRWLRSSSVSVCHVFHTSSHASSTSVLPTQSGWVSRALIILRVFDGLTEYLTSVYLRSPGSVSRIRILLWVFDSINRVLDFSSTYTVRDRWAGFGSCYEYSIRLTESLTSVLPTQSGIGEQGSDLVTNIRFD